MTALEKWPEPIPVKLTIEDFLHLDARDAFKSYAKTELIGGQVVAMNAQYSLHAHVKSTLFRRLANACDTALPAHNVWTEVSMAVPPNDLPEPDILVTSFRPEERAPVPAGTVSLIVEVADTTIRYDLGEKAILYASAGVPEYWVFDISARVIHQLWTPSGNAFAERRTVIFGDCIDAATIAGLQVATKGL